MTQQEWTIGPGVQQAMADSGDEPRSNEQYIVTSDTGFTISQTFGRDAIYWWYEEDNAVKRVPFR
jgi:hypothetical protein